MRLHFIGQAFTGQAGLHKRAAACMAAAYAIGWSAFATPTIVVQPQNADARCVNTVTFSVIAEGVGPLSYQWRVNGAPLTDDGYHSGISTPVLTIQRTDLLASGWYNVFVSDATGSIASDTAFFINQCQSTCIPGRFAHPCIPPCGCHDGIDCLLNYLGVYDAGGPRADLDDGSGTGTRDGGVTIDDLLYFLYRFELGC